MIAPPLHRDGKKEKSWKRKKQENKTTERNWNNIDKREGEGERSQVKSTEKKNDEIERDTGEKQRRVTKEKVQDEEAEKEEEDNGGGGKRMRRSSSKTGSASRAKNVFSFSWHFENLLRGVRTGVSL